MHILVVDDEELIRAVIKNYLDTEAYTYDEADNGEEAVKLVEDNNYDLIIMDIMMPKMDGYEAVKKIKAINKNIPVIMLSARKEEEDKLQGFDYGIDDYVTKPFSPKELMARIKAVTKRTDKEGHIKVGNIELDSKSYQVFINGENIDVTDTQFELLKLFLTNQNIALSRDKIIESIWGYDYEADDRTIDAHIKLLRAKLGKYRNSIKTIRKVGYKFNYEEE